MKKVTFILASLNRGGAERVISILSDYCSKKGMEVDIILLLFNEVSYNIAENIHIYDFTGGQQSRIKRLPYWIKSIRRYVKENKPDVIVSFVARINVIVQTACLGLKQHIIVSERNDPYSDGRSRMVDMLTALLYPKADSVVFQTKRAAGYFKKCDLKARIISNPISVEMCADAPQKGKIVSVGRLYPQKNHKMLIEAVADAKKTVPYVQLYIYGEGELKEELQQYAEKFGISDAVHFMGNVPDVHRQISDADIFVLSSDYEGLSNALLEAMMMGLPCISTNCAGSDEYIENGKNGILVPVGDCAAMSSAISKLLSDSDLKKKLGENARLTSAEFAKEPVLQKWFELINSVSEE